MQRLLITGVDTMLGSNLALALAGRYQVFGLYEQHEVRCRHVETAEWSPFDMRDFTARADYWQPDWHIHCSPLSASSWEPAPTDDLLEHEPHVVGELAAQSRRRGTLFTLLSSDAVLTGPRMFADESCPLASDTPRLTSTLAMEQAAGDDALIVRTHAYGWSFDGLPLSFAELAYRHLQSVQPGPALPRRYATPILATDLAAGLHRACELRLRGLYHVAGAERTSTQRFISELATALDCAPPPALATHTDHAHEETSLSSRRAKRVLGIAPPMLREGLERFVAQASSGWRHAWQNRGSVSPLRYAA